MPTDTESTAPLWTCERQGCDKRYIDGHLLRKCAGCRRAYYCSKECQRAGWPAHKSDCRIIQETPGARKILPSHTTANASWAKVCKYLYGTTPAEERIRWIGRDLFGPANDNHEPHLIRGRQFLQELIPNIGVISGYAVEKFITTKCRGAVFLDFTLPVPIIAERYNFAWLGESSAWGTKDSRIIKLVSGYDPAKSAVVFCYAIEPQGRFMYLTGFASGFPDDFLPHSIFLRVEEAKQTA